MTAPIWVGLDDTDSPTGGCTTHALTEVVEAAHASGLALIGEPRLVRLNPNIPFKTRGNAALAARFGIGYGSRRLQGEGPSGAIWSYTRGRRARPEVEHRFVEAAWEAVRRGSKSGDLRTDPAMVASTRVLPGSLYREAVSRLVPRDDVARLLQNSGAWVRSEGSGQGIVGAASAIAWPARRATWELITYRSPDRWGSPRSVDAASVRAAQSRFPALFLCHDPRTRRLLVAPHTACPILFGLRSRDRQSLRRALATVRSEVPERWMIFRTNQGTGDHLVRRSVAQLRPFDAARVLGRVSDDPVILPGGHVRWPVVDPAGDTIECLAFEPTKTLPRVAEDLVTGDVVEVWGGRADDAVFRVEGLRVIRRSTRRGAARPPPCVACEGPTHSMGRGRGFRCRRCGARFPPERAEWRERPRFGVGTFHPTPSARRHLAPLGPEGPETATLAAPLVTDLYRP